MSIKEIDPAAVPAAIAGGALLIDVREPSEWDAGHAPDAVHLPMGDVTADHTALRADQPIFVICRSGGRSAAVTEALTTWGFDATNVLGGMQGWAALGLPMQATGGADPTVA